MARIIADNIFILSILLTLYLFLFWVFFRRSISNILEPAFYNWLSLSFSLSFFTFIFIKYSIDFVFFIYVITCYFIFISSNFFIKKQHITSLKQIHADKYATIYSLIILQILSILIFFTLYGSVGNLVRSGSHYGVTKLTVFEGNPLAVHLYNFISNLSSFLSLAVVFLWLDNKSSFLKGNRILCLLFPSVLFYFSGASKAPLLSLIFAVGIGIKKRPDFPARSIVFFLLVFFGVSFMLFSGLFNGFDNFMIKIAGRAWGEGDLYYYLFGVKGSLLDSLKVGTFFDSTILQRTLLRLGYGERIPSLGVQLIDILYQEKGWGPNSIAPIWGYLWGGYFGGGPYILFISAFYLIIVKMYNKSRYFSTALFWGYLNMNIFTLFRDRSLFFGNSWFYLWPLFFLYFAIDSIYVFSQNSSLKEKINPRLNSKE